MIRYDTVFIANYCWNNLAGAESVMSKALTMKVVDPTPKIPNL